MSVPRPKVLAALAVVLAAATWFAFSGALANGHLRLDDPTYVFGNEVVRRGLTADGWRYAWTSGDAANWHPLTWLAHMLDVELYGLDAGKHHAVSVALHVVDAVLVLVLFARWTGRTGVAFFAAGLFALHPLRVESVAWIAERKDVLSALFFLLALHAWTSFARGGSRAAWAGAFVATALGLLAKPMLVTLPFLLLVLDAWPFERVSRGWRALLLEKAPFFALAVASSVATYVAQHAWGAVASTSVLPFGERAMHSVVAYFTYLRLELWPADLAIYYPHPLHTEPAAAALALLGLVALGFVCWRARKSSPWLATAALWCAGLLVPVIGLVQVGQQSHADRYTYLPFLGPVLALALELDTRARSATVRRALAALGVVVLAVLATRTREQVELWRDSRTLFAHTVRVTKDNAMARQNLGNALLEAGDVDGAIRELSECVRLSPSFPDAQNNLGVALAAKGLRAEAVERFRAAIELGQGTASVHANLARALFELGRLDESEREARKALELDAGHAQAHERLGAALAGLGRREEALVELERAVELEPGSIEHRRALGVTLVFFERDAEAANALAEALAIAPDDAECAKNLAWLRATSFDAGVRDANAALELATRALRVGDANDARLQDVVGAARAAAGDFDGAIAAASRAVELWRARGREPKAAEVEARVALYRSRVPFVRAAPEAR